VSAMMASCDWRCCGGPLELELELVEVEEGSDYAEGRCTWASVYKCVCISICVYNVCICVRKIFNQGGVGPYYQTNVHQGYWPS
jgi:hypothetical protein